MLLIVLTMAKAFSVSKQKIIGTIESKIECLKKIKIKMF